VLSALGYNNLRWRQGSGDRGRDIECENFSKEPDGNVASEKWFAECKRYESGVNVGDLQSKIAWADAESPNYLLFIVSSHLTPDAKDWIAKIERDKKYKIRYWERKYLEKLIQENTTKISNIEKYFLTIEDDLNELYKRFYRSKQLLKERKIEQIKILEGAIKDFNDPTKQRELADKYKNLALIKKDLKEFNQAVDDLDNAQEIYQQIADSEATFDIILLKGDFEIEQNRGLYASQRYDDAYKFAAATNNLQWMSRSKYKAGIALHSTYTFNNFHRALQAYQEAIRLYPENEVNINLKMAELTWIESYQNLMKYSAN
jgi:tetratricopeptide (TPR) repeat protein